MIHALKNIGRIFDGDKGMETTIEGEMAEFTGHLSNIKGFMSERNQRLATSHVRLARLYLKAGTREGVEKELSEALGLPLDYSHKTLRKFKAGVGIHGVGVEVER